MDKEFDSGSRRSKSPPRKKQREIDNLMTTGPSMPHGRSADLQKLTLGQLEDYIESGADLSTLVDLEKLLSTLSKQSGSKVKERQSTLPDLVIENIYKSLSPKSRSRYLRTSKQVSNALGVDILEESRKLEELDTINTRLSYFTDKYSRLRPDKVTFPTWLFKNLLDMGADPNITSTVYYTTPLIVAILFNNEELVKYLLEKGSSRDKCMQLSTLSEVPWNCIANPNKPNKRGTLPLQLAVDLNYPKIVELLLNAGADVNKRSNKQLKENTALIIATHKNNESIVDLLFKYGADPNIKNLMGETGLMHAIPFNTDTNIFKKYIKHGADVNVQDNNGSTPLILAVIKNKPMFVEELLKARADPYIVDDKYNTAMEYAIEQDNKEIIRIFKKYKLL